MKTMYLSLNHYRVCISRGFMGVWKIKTWEIRTRVWKRRERLNEGQRKGDEKRCVYLLMMIKKKKKSKKPLSENLVNCEGWKRREILEENCRSPGGRKWPLFRVAQLRNGFRSSTPCSSRFIVLLRDSSYSHCRLRFARTIFRKWWKLFF